MQDNQLFDVLTQQEINRLLSDWTLEVGLQFDLRLTAKEEFQDWLTLSLTTLDIESALSERDLPATLILPDAHPYRVDFANDLELTFRLFGLTVIIFEEICHAHQ